MGEEKKTGKGGGGGGGDKKKDAGAGAAPQPIVLKVDLHCAGCANKVRKAIKRAPGAYGLPAVTQSSSCGGELFVPDRSFDCSVAARVQAWSR
jgi:copper chaperone CopZ